jgi:ribosomal protein S27E
MKKKIDKEEKICWACKRTLVEESKLGLCPDCVNKYGTPAAAACALGLGVLGKQALKKHGGKAVKVVTKVIRYIK